MMLQIDEIDLNKTWLATFTKTISKKSDFYSALSDPTRLKILFLLKKNKELCVTDFSEVLNITISAVSHQLSLLEKSDFVIRTKMGKIVCYSLSDQSITVLKELNI